MNARAGLLALVAAAACWGASIVMIRFASDELGVASLTALESVAAAGSLLATLAVTGRRLPRPTRRLILVSVLEPGLSYVLINYGVAHTSGSHASLIIGTESVFVIGFAAAANRTRPSLGVIAGLLLATAGTALIAESSSAHASLRGDVVVFVGILAAAAYVVLVQPLATYMDALELTAAQFSYGGLVTLPLLGVCAATGALPSFDWAPTRFILAAFGVGIVGSMVAFSLYNWALKHASPSVSGVSLTLIPLFGLAFSVTLLGDELSTRTVFATLAVLAGVTITSRSDAASAAPV